jgi:hypothetical protein
LVAFGADRPGAAPVTHAQEPPLELECLPELGGIFGQTDSEKRNSFQGRLFDD